MKESDEEESKAFFSLCASEDRVAEFNCEGVRNVCSISAPNIGFSVQNSYKMNPYERKCNLSYLMKNWFDFLLFTHILVVCIEADFFCSKMMIFKRKYSIF